MQGKSSGAVAPRSSFDLDRFVDAQIGTYERALSELARAAKRTHWMWYIFPQIAGLGVSETARRYGIRSLEEARGYLTHPLLGPRYRQSVQTLQDIVDHSAIEVFGATDAKKLQSSLTLFHEAAPQERLFEAALERWFGGKKDQATLELLRGARSSSFS